MVDYVTGVLQIANLFLSFVAGLIAISLFRISRRNKPLKPWKYLIIVLLLFAVEELLGVLRSFNIFSTPHLTHIVPGIMLAFLIVAMLLEEQCLGEKVKK